MRIRSFAETDLESVQQLIHRTIDACYSGVYPPRAVGFFKQFHSRSRILERHAIGDVLVIEDAGSAVATGSVVGDEISGVFVHPRYQGRGIGRQMMDRLEDIARTRGHVRAHLAVSLPSEGFYSARGYEILGSRSIEVGAGDRLDYWEAVKTLTGSESEPDGRC